MNYPSVKTLAKAFGADKAKAIRKAMDESRGASGYTTTSAAVQALEKIDVILGTHGVEYIPAGHNAKSPAIDYCNTGDTYDTTVLWVHGGVGFRIGNWGSYVEAGNYD
jgi:hypothetical protein